MASGSFRKRFRKQREQPLDRDIGCFNKARALGEPTFTLRAQDVSAPAVVAEWIKQNVMTCPAGKLREALDTAIKMREWPSKKHAD